MTNNYNGYMYNDDDSDNVKDYNRTYHAHNNLIVV